MTREELTAHLEATEEQVRRMTEGVNQKLDKHLEVMQASNERFQAEVREDLADMRKDFASIQESNERFKAEVREDLASMKESNKWTYRVSAATLTILIIVVGLMGIFVQ